MTLSPPVAQALTAGLLLVGIGCMLGLAGCAYMLARNRWVYRQRMEALAQGIAHYERLPSYDEMMYRWWIWDVNAFLEPKT